MTGSDIIKVDWFKIITGILMPITLMAFAYQQNQISALGGKLDAYKDTIYPKLTQIEVSVGKVETSIANIQRQLEDAIITK